MRFPLTLATAVMAQYPVEVCDAAPEARFQPGNTEHGGRHYRRDAEPELGPEARFRPGNTELGRHYRRDAKAKAEPKARYRPGNTEHGGRHY
jgi:hypothetical protein